MQREARVNGASAASSDLCSSPPMPPLPPGEGVHGDAGLFPSRMAPHPRSLQREERARLLSTIPEAAACLCTRDNVYPSCGHADRKFQKHFLHRHLRRVLSSWKGRRAGKTTCSRSISERETTIPANAAIDTSRTGSASITPITGDGGTRRRSTIPKIAMLSAEGVMSTAGRGLGWTDWYTPFKMKQLGEQRYNALMVRAHQTGKKDEVLARLYF